MSDESHVSRESHESSLGHAEQLLFSCVRSKGIGSQIPQIPHDLAIP